VTDSLDIPGRETQTYFSCWTFPLTVTTNASPRSARIACSIICGKHVEKFAPAIKF
jgi:hypothetical protein